MNWDDITIGKLQAIQEIDDTFNPIERAAHIVAIIKGIPYEEVQQWTMKKLKEFDLSFLSEMPKSKFTFSFKHKNRRFKLVANAKEMKAHHFIELQEVAKEDIIDNLHIIIALLSYRVNFWGKRIEDDYDWKVENFKDLKAVDFNNYALFFRLSIRSCWTLPYPFWRRGGWKWRNFWMVIAHRPTRWRQTDRVGFNLGDAIGGVL